MSQLVEDKPWRVGLCGCGSSLQIYEGIHLLGQPFQLVAVADPDPKRIQLAVEKWNISHAYSTAKEMFEKEKLRLVLIATPPSSHLDLILEAAEFGAHILVQKPLARTLKEARQITETCQKHKVALKVSFVRRYTPAFVAARQLVEALGRGLALRVSWCSSSGLRPRSDKLWKEKTETLGGVLVDLGTHVVDVGRWWMGEIKDGYLTMSIVRGELDNIAAFLLLHTSGSSTICYVSNVEYSSSEAYEYIATSGGFTLERQTEGYPGAWVLQSWKAGEVGQKTTYFESPVTNPFLAEIVDFISAIHRGETTVDKGSLGAGALRTTTLLYRSASNTKDCDLEDFSLDDFFRASQSS